MIENGINHTDLNLTILDKVSGIEEEELKQRIKRWGGRVFVWVHSHHKEPSAFTIKPGSAFEKYSNSRRKRFERSHIGPPIITLIEAEEDDENLQQSHYLHWDNFKRLGAKGTIYFVPTYRGDPTPNYFRLKNNKYDTNYELAWKILSDRLKQLGVTTIVLFGRNYNENSVVFTDVMPRKLVPPYMRFINSRFAQVWRDGIYQILPSQCVGVAYVSFLVDGFKVIISKAIFPNVPSVPTHKLF